MWNLEQAVDKLTLHFRKAKTMREHDTRPHWQPFARRMSPASLLLRGFFAFVFLVGSVLFVQFAWTSAKAAWNELEPHPAIMLPQPKVLSPAKPKIEIEEPDLV
jgi:hypothetical protein